MHLCCVVTNLLYGCKPDLQQSRGCLGCCTKPPLIIAVDEPSKGLRIRGQAVKKPSIPDDFWSTSTCEMDNSAVQSQRSVSSMSTSNPPLDPYGNVGSTSNPTEFVNHGKFKPINFSCYLLLAIMVASFFFFPFITKEVLRHCFWWVTSTHPSRYLLVPKTGN